MFVAQDYMDLFSMNRKGHMGKYIYLVNSSVYEDVLKQPGYYPFRMENSILDQKSRKIASCFSNLTQVLEIGPGSSTAVVSKVIPFLEELSIQHSLLSYHALDFCFDYAQEASQIIGDRFKTIKTKAYEIDFLKSRAFKKIENLDRGEGNRLLVGFGQTFFANNTQTDTHTLLENLTFVLGDKDYLLFSIDMTQDKLLLENAYHTSSIYSLLLNVMHYLKLALNLPHFDPEAFDFVYEWNHEEYQVKLSLKPKVEQIIQIEGCSFVLGKNNVYNIINSRKPSISFIEKFFNQHSLVIQDVIKLDDVSQENGFSFIIAKKVGQSRPLREAC